MLKLIVIVMTLVSSNALADSLKQQIKRNKPSISESSSNMLASHIRKYSKIYNISENLYAAILMQESTYNVKAINKKCGFRYIANEVKQEVDCVVADVGISQINVKTVESYGFNPERLQQDLEYSVRAGAIVLSWFKEKYKEKEPNTWYCRYNTGTRAFHKIEQNCLHYKKLVDRFK